MKVLKPLLLSLLLVILLVAFSGCDTEPEFQYFINEDGESCTITHVTSARTVAIPTEIDGYRVTAIGDYAFSGHSQLVSVTIPDTITSIGENAFYNCNKLKSIIIPDSVTSIGSHAFEKCTELKSVSIGNGVTSIGSEAFLYCYDLDLSYKRYHNAYYLGNETNPYLVLMKATDSAITSCTVHEDTKVIYGSAFAHCSKLSSVTLGNNITNIGLLVFYNCTKLTSITYNGTKAEWETIEKRFSWNYKAGEYVVHCTNGNTK